ncbi:MAG: hypothetical protein II888_00100 [Clostridia bacterium]|nr:hypothetical protein [Clostridia bacterium]
MGTVQGKSRIWPGRTALLIACFLLCLRTGLALGETRVTADPAQAQVGGVVDVRVESGEGAESVVYTLRCGGQTVFQGEEDSHFVSAFRPRQEGEYTLSVTVKYADGGTETAEASVSVSGMAEETQGPEKIYSQKDGWWKDKEYSKSELDNAGCAIFTLSHALQRMGWTGEDIAPENLAVNYKNCYTKNGTAVARLVFNASQVYGYATKSALQKDAPSLREGLKNGDYYSFSVALGHIALMTGVDEKSGKVRVVDSAPSATFERIKKGKIYILKDGEYAEVTDPGEVPGAKYYFETRFYGGLEYYMDLSYCARRGGRLIRPTWLYYRGPEGKIGAALVNLTSGESEITVNGQAQKVLTRDLIWGDEGKPRLAAVIQKKAVRLLNEEGKRIGSVPRCSLVPVLREEEDRVYVMYEEHRGYLRLSDVEVFAPLEGAVQHGIISVNGNTSGRATVKMRFGASGKTSVVDNWKTGTEVILIRQEDGFWLVEAKGLRLWVSEEYITVQ